MDEKTKTFYHARYILNGFEWLEDAYLSVENGRIDGVHPTKNELPVQCEPGQTVELGEVALVPGLVNAHSHAFQRGIRGKTEYLVADREEEDFWSWREEMYRAALGYDADRVEEVSRLAFLEMALSGITSVGEFHYLHHQPDGTPYGDPNELANRVIRAARDVGIRIALLRVGYHRGGFEQPAESAQRRFVEPDVDTYLSRADALRSTWEDEPTVTVGLAPHSIRAVPSPWLQAASDYADQHDLPLHIHACEQRREIDESRREYGMAPVEVFEDLGMLSERLTLVHGTHLSEEELDLLGERRPTVCACPTTERNLGDGFLPALELAKRRVPVALGSDSHTNIDLWEEMRLVEYHERLRYERRNVLATQLAESVLGPGGDRRLPTANALWPMGTLDGARSLGLQAGRLQPGCLADFVAIDLDHITLVGTTRETLLADITLSMTPGAVRDVFVGGEQIVEDGRHPLLNHPRE
ncbi:MAG: formimidoylglutamate deiminase [Persicimonas sp.]